LRRHIVSCAAAILLACAAPDARAQPPREPSAVELAPGGSKAKRYASLKGDRVLLRQGPGDQFPTAWVFRRTGLPVEIIREVEVWREIRDASGTVGWVHGSLLSRRRTALVLPWAVKDGQPGDASATLREDDRESARPIARVEAGALVNIISCENGWCRISIGEYRGYVEQAKLWGTYPNESIK
jgi:SH3-like domain-containing protein